MTTLSFRVLARVKSPTFLSGVGIAFSGTYIPGGQRRSTNQDAIVSNRKLLWPPS